MFLDTFEWASKEPFWAFSALWMPGLLSRTVLLHTRAISKEELDVKTGFFLLEGPNSQFSRPALASRDSALGPLGDRDRARARRAEAQQ